MRSFLRACQFLLPRLFLAASISVIVSIGSLAMRGMAFKHPITEVVLTMALYVLINCVIVLVRE